MPRRRLAAGIRSLTLTPTLTPTLTLTFNPNPSPNPQLSHLDLREIDAGDGGLVALAAAGARGALAQLKHLDLRHNPIGNPGTGALADALSSHLAPAVAFASLARLHLQLPWRFRDRMGSTRNLRPSPSPSRAAFSLHTEPTPRSTRPPTTTARFQQCVR